MKTKLLAVVLLASAALIAPLQAGGGNHGGGGGGGGGFGGGGRGAARGGGGAPSFRSMPAGGFGGGASFRSMPTRSFGGNRMIYSSPRVSSVGPRSPGSMEFRQRSVNSRPNMSIQSRQFARGNNNRVDRASRFASGGNQSLANARAARNGQFRNGANQIRNGNGNLRSGWRNHVVAQHSGNWRRDWDRHHDHFFHGHRFVFIDGFWFGFDAGFDPWWPWYYPYDYYGYGYTYPYSYDDNPDYYSGAYYRQNGYADQSGNSTVAAVQERLARDGYYRGQIDGVFGPETRAAIAQFQSNDGLRANGGLTNETLAALGVQAASY
jgi:hypothetical protein